MLSPRGCGRHAYSSYPAGYKTWWGFDQSSLKLPRLELPVEVHTELPTDTLIGSPAVLAEPLEPDQPHEAPIVRALIVADPASRAVAGTDAPHHDVGNPVKSAVEA